MADALRDSYLESVAPEFAPLVRALDEAVRQAAPELGIALKYGLLMYGLDGDFRHWVCAVGTVKSAACLRFLYGQLMSDPRGVFRAGTSILRTIDVHSLEELDVELVTSYVREAVQLLPTYREQARILYDRQGRRTGAQLGE